MRFIVIVLQTPRLIVRNWHDADLPAFADLNADPDVMAHFPATLTREQSDALANRLRQRMDDHGFGLWAVQCLEATGKEGDFIGFVGLNRVPFEADFTPAVEIAWRLARPFWGRGYAIEAARACVAHGFGTLNLPRIDAFTVPANVRSRRVMETLGMRYAGEFEHPLLPPGHALRCHVRYQLERPNP
ncbi:GNAT family N-acetyltransferase [Bordetella avium]|uniref:GNAT family N-acetyltransferase n=1 Tax=Bordetella avium TaxID=521 RepID=UPI000E0B1670|nr:GNAT family N-acetyltransferase [Bordetella avium]AZY52587.1 GNAT family N-acetyltransferase [Bordetella avium]RIQ12711.1 GNAT family N-acetyltransferase [Bordetella avium]RIQ37883.1 GNAT family N-acetyltransferase [Bordetella avium]RIQ39178.1 GNAT family N-acetyltransferase [Bordetella avium]RIQ43613.1 GNAT family N-acetyltransferase [Bordetella avium]